jgi:hypothetical protein
MRFSAVAVSALVSSFFFASTTVPLVSAAPAATTCSSTEDDDRCKEDETLVCGIDVKDKKNGSSSFLQMCKKDRDIKDVPIGGSLGGDLTLASCGCCTESTDPVVLAALSSNSAKLKFTKSAKKSSKKSAKDDKTGCRDLSELICQEALPGFTLTASQDEDYGLVTLQTGYSGNHCTWRGGELDGTCPENNCIVRDTSSIPHVKNVCVHDGVGTL